MGVSKKMTTTTTNLQLQSQYQTQTKGKERVVNDNVNPTFKPQINKKSNKLVKERAPIFSNDRY